MTCAVLAVAAGLLAGAAACGTDGSADAHTDAGADVDAVRDSGTPRDAASDGGLCDVYAPFDPPEVVSGLGPPGDRISAFLSDDELRIVYGLGIDDGDGGVNFDLFEATRSVASASFTTFRPLSELNTPGAEHSATLSPDFKTIYFYSYSPPEKTGHVARSARPDENGAFTSPVRVGALDIQNGVSSPFLAHHAQELWLTEQGDNASFSIYRSSLGADGIPGTPQLVAGLHSGDDTSPVLGADGLTIYWSSSSNAPFSRHIFVATRASTTDAFGTVHAVNELNSSYGDYPLWLSVDQCRLYFGSYKTPVQKLYMASRRPCVDDRADP